ncbi:MAG TPA: hypothetical protein VLS89_10485 [Candidatus Nanopelagicales bacterium]|nr:hypothetical protein [Candidatus Nanopelagicales bacterium]
MRNHLSFLALSVLLLLLAGCSDPKGPGPGTIVFGLTTELQPGVDIDRMRVVARVGGEVVRDELLTTQDGTLELPAEVPLEDLEDGTAVELELEAFRPGDPVMPLVTRMATTEVAGDKTLLFRVRLERECVIPPGGGGCAAPETCVGGACQSPEVNPADLEEYTPGWAVSEPDICKPAGAGDPVVIVGKGQGDYLPLDALEEVQVEAGPQGGYHTWVAVRMKNLRRSGSITSISGYVPALDHEIRPFDVIFTFDPDEGGYCTLHGLRFQLDGDIDVQELLGQVVRIQVTVTDSEGDVGVGEREVTLSTTIL